MSRTSSATSAAPPPAKLGAGRRGFDLSRTIAAAADLLESGDRAHAGVAEDARDLLLSEIEPDPLQPRRHFDQAALRALAEDIERRGVLQPVLVRPPAEPGGKYRLVAGERRWRAAGLAGRVRIPARVREIADEDVRAAQLAENVLRADLSDIEKGRALRALYELRKSQDPKRTWDDVAAEVGLGRVRIHDLYHLSRLPSPVADLITAGRLSGSHGIALQRAMEELSEEEVYVLAERAARPEGRVGGYRLSVARLREAIQEAIAAKRGTTGGGPAATAPTAPPLRPFVRRTLEALARGRLSDGERLMLLEALGDPPPDQEVAG